MLQKTSDVLLSYGGQPEAKQSGGASISAFPRLGMTAASVF